MPHRRFSRSIPPKMVLRCFQHFDLFSVPQQRALFGIFQSGLQMVCLVHFDLEMCFSPRRHAIFRHPNCQKYGLKLGCCVHFYLAATCTRSFLVWPNVSAPAALASLHCNPLEPQIIGNTTFLTFRAPVFFFLLTLSTSLFCSSLCYSSISSTLLSHTLIFSLTLPISAFHLSILWEV